MHRLGWSIVLLSLATVGCGKSPRTDAGVAPSARVASSSALAPSAGVASANAVDPPSVPRGPAPPFVAADAPPIAAPAAPACVLQTTDVLSYRGGLPLRAGPTSAAFVRLSEEGARLGPSVNGQGPLPVSGGAVRVIWPVGGDAVIAELARGAFDLRALAPADTRVHAARAMTLADVLAVGAGMGFTLAGTANGSVVPTIATPGFRPRKPLDARGCKDFMLGVSKVDGYAGRPTPKLVTERWLRADDLPVAATADGEPVLDLSFANRRVVVLEEKGGRSRIVFATEAGSVVGWVATTDLLTSAGPLVDVGLEAFGPWRAPTGTAQPPAAPEVHEHTCTQDIPLYVDLTDAPTDDRARLPYARIGSIQRNRPFDVGPERGGLYRIAATKVQDLIFTEPARLAVAKDDLEKRCRRRGAGL